jgi:hypothetical protein
LLAQVELPELAPGEETSVDLAGRASDATPVLETELELLRAPDGFLETREAAVRLRLDPLGAAAPRRPRARASPAPAPGARSTGARSLESCELARSRKRPPG